MEKVVFETDFADLFGVVTRPRAWPVFRYQNSELRKALDGFQEWNILVVSSRVNKYAQTITKCVTVEMHYHLYVAQGNLQWLEDPFEAENKLVISGLTHLSYILLKSLTTSNVEYTPSR